MSSYTTDIHTSLSSCLLCRQQASPGSLILDLSGKHLIVPTGCIYPCPRCSKSPNPSVWFHLDCYDILKDSYTTGWWPTLKDLQRFAAAVRPLYKPENKGNINVASTQEGLLCRSTRNILKDGFTQELFRRFPTEIQDKILEFLGPCWYLIVLGETRRLIEQMRNDYLFQSQQLNLTKGLYIGRTKYQGNSYISTISNEPLRVPSTYDQQYIKSPTYTKKVILSFDHVGIRRLQFLEQGSKPLPDGAPWYEIRETTDCHFNASISWSGLFVRRIKFFAEGWDKTLRIWSSPEVPKLNPWNLHIVWGHSFLNHVKLDANIHGLIVCCSRSVAIGIYGFTGISKAYKALVKLMNQRAYGDQPYWFYYPINKGEFITAAWIHKWKRSRSSASPISLAIRTSLGRDIFYEYRPLVKNGDGAISGIVHEGVDLKYTHGIVEIGVTCNPGCQVETPEQEPQFGRYECPPTRYTRPMPTWYLTKAPVEGLYKVRVCRDLEKTHRPCIGLLLYYEEGRVESLGQVHWDLDLTQDVLAPIYIGKGSIDGNDYIKDVQRDAACTRLESEVDIWQKIPENGTIVWWFSYLGDKVTMYTDP
ncbi:hypothetical protein BDV39DRAFT_191412 [Aspergillus sergii]|uniref:Uncharacterized protein n=1 Tax=Aspergillus sergii TaxID=1034303 RepID=A0A5N6X7I0_9EURO|nr:hypothetical protein BDV39DRAFT_191412 [Aspergillus sergii]